MAVTSTRFGRVIPGTTPRAPMQDDGLNFDWENAFRDDDEGTALREQDTGGGSSVPSWYYKALADAASARAAQSGQRLEFDISKFLGQQNVDLAKILQTQKEFDVEQAAKAAELARSQAGAKAAEDYIRGLMGQGVPQNITDLLTGQQTTGTEDINRLAADLLNQINAREEQARGLTSTGYSNLMNYLARVQPTAFAQAQRAMPTITQSALGRYMAGQGVSPAAAEQAAQLANIQAAGGASNYNQLLNVLAAQEQAAAGSRQAEAQMGLNTALAALQAMRMQQAGGLEQQRLGAISDLNQRIAAARLQAEAQATARDQALQDALLRIIASGLTSSAAAASGTGGTTEGGGTTGGGGTTSGGGTTGGGMTPEQTAAANLAAAGMSPETAALILGQNIGNPLVPGGIPDYLRVIQEQTARNALSSLAGGGGLGAILGNEAVMV